MLSNEVLYYVNGEICEYLYFNAIKDVYVFSTLGDFPKTVYLSRGFERFAVPVISQAMTPANFKIARQVSC